MEAVPVSMGRGSNKARQPQGGQSEFINAYVEDLGEAGKTGFTAQAINGQQQFAALAGSPTGVERMLELDSILLAVAYRQLSSITSAGVATYVGDITTDGFTTMAANRKSPNRQVAIVRNGSWWIYENGVLTQGTDPDLPPPIAVAEIYGYFIFLIADGRWFIAGPNSGLTINAVDFVEAEASSDGNVMVIIRGTTILIFGTRSTQFYDPTPDPVFPFSATAAISVGCYAAGSVAKVLVQKPGARATDTVVFAATDGDGAYAGVMMLDGYTPIPISTGEVDRLIRDETVPANIRSMGWTEDGRPFYAISGSTWTMVYDFKSGEWHKRKSAGRTKWRPQCHVQFGTKVLFGYYNNNTINRSLPTLLDEVGDPITWVIQPPPISMFPKGFKVNALYVDMITGVGANSTSDDDANPVLVIDVSKDGGVNFGAQRRAALGAEAQRQVRVKERVFGRFDHNGATFRFSCSAKVVKAMQQLAIVATPLRM